MTADNLRFVKDFAAGGASAVVAKTVVAPVERVKLLLQLQGTRKQAQHYKGIIDCFKRVPVEQGFFSLWRGNMANLLRYVPQQAIQLSCKDTYKRWFMTGLTEDQFWKFLAGNLAAGGAAGATALCFVYPMDFARTRLAVDIGRGKTREFKGLGHCFRSILRTDGVIGLYRGFFVSVQFVIIYRAAFFGFFDTGHAMLGKSHELNFFAAWAIAQVSTNSAGMLTYPMDTVRRCMMMQSGRIHPLYKNSLDCYRTIIKVEGWRALYKGALANLLRESGGALLLAMYVEIEKYI
uniref:ADP/ATP translocase n=1 Tax=Plectus sambesii TaxID=2011161 RepID=A0A914WAE8_9BILA